MPCASFCMFYCSLINCVKSIAWVLSALRVGTQALPALGQIRNICSALEQQGATGEKKPAPWAGFGASDQGQNYMAKIQLTSWRALPSVIATALGGMERPLTLPFQWLL